MKKIGTVTSISDDKLIAKLSSQQIPRIGSKIYNKDKKELGKLKEFFGPTKAPYVIIQTGGNTLYMGDIYA